MRNIKLLLEYDGTNYVGWQRQENGRSIQSEIEKALSQILQVDVSVIGAGRTDAGVHARGQVANFRTKSGLSVEEVQRGLNALLPEDIVALQAEEVSLDFHARFSAKERTYSYNIAQKPVALMRNYAWQVNYDLDPEIMKRTAELVTGTHDFESFCKVNADVNHHLCTVSLSRWFKLNSTLVYEIRANRFLHGMVRALVGTMVDIGRGHTTFEEFLRILGKKDRKEAGIAAPARGLVLESVSY